MNEISRRQVLGVVAGSIGAATVGCAPAAAAAEPKKPPRKYRTEDFYDGGKFDGAAAKDCGAL